MNSRQLCYLSVVFNVLVLGSFLLFTFVLNDSNRPDPAVPPYDKLLTPEQKSRVDSLKEQFSVETDSLRRQALAVRLHIWEELMKDQPDTARIQKLFRQLELAELQLRQIRNQYYLKEMRVLTPDQRRERLSYTYERLKERWNIP